MRRFRQSTRWRIGGLVAVACLAGLNLWRTHVVADEGDSPVVVVENVYLRNDPWSGLKELVVAEGPRDENWGEATAHLHDIRMLTVENRDVSEEEVGRFLYLHPEIRHVDMELVRISGRCADRLIDCPDLKSVRLGEKNRATDAAVQKLKTELPDVVVSGYYELGMTACFGPDEKGRSGCREPETTTQP